MLQKITLTLAMFGVLTFGTMTYAFMPPSLCGQCLTDVLAANPGMETCEALNICVKRIDQRVERCIRCEVVED